LFDKIQLLRLNSNRALPMTNCTQDVFDFPALKRRKVQAEFSGGDITSDGGALLLRQVDKRLGLLQAVDAVIPDPRDRRYVAHSQLSLLRQRVYGICLGYEDLNDHQTLRIDPALQSSIEREEVLGSQSTLCRLENRIDRQVAVNIHKLLLEQFIASHDEPPDELILDFDATDDPVHGRQEGRFFHGYYDHYCFLPLYVFCADQLLVSYLRPSQIDGAKHAWAILALLVKRLRQAWPEVRIVFRGDSGFCRHRMLTWCERNGVHYIVGIAKNDALLRCIAQLRIPAQSEHSFRLKMNTFSGFSGIGVHVPGMGVHVQPEQVFMLNQNGCSDWAGIRIPTLSQLQTGRLPESNTR
jgi:hypothetical protein